ncbi:MAG: LamB/YcsF family protein [Myxococcales bacterium]|nr:LamB/YcsF family protein [Myxococcales bacterium]
MRVTLNVDLGELPDEPEELYALADVANVACGGHAGDAASMRRACRLARAHGTKVFAHPSYPDREGFGRRAIAMDPGQLRASLAEQCAALLEAAAAAGVVVEGVKPHGSLYHAVATDLEVARVAVEGCSAIAGPWVISPGARLAELVSTTLVEGFADRGYADDGTLRPREAPGALLHDATSALDQARALLRSGRFQTLCVHGDRATALPIARAIRALLDEPL